MHFDSPEPAVPPQSLTTIAVDGQTIETLVEFAGSDLAIGRYRLQHKLGSGGMGEVWAAEQQQPVRRQVALKLIRSDRASQEIISRFNSERQALALMSHPNIAKILDAGTASNGQPFFVMELVDGQPLTSFCDKQRLDIDQRLRLYVDICLAVQHAHQKGIIHRDLKPSNILVSDQDGKPSAKVIDFGLAKALHRDQFSPGTSDHTQPGQILGTLKYMSPEQAQMHDASIDVRTDVYSMGVILYELLTGSTPSDQFTLQDRSPISLLQSLHQRDPVRPSRRINSIALEQRSEIANQRQTSHMRLERTLSGDLDWIVMKSLELEPERRYGSVAELANDVQRYLSSEPIAARPPSIRYQVGKLARKYKTVFYASSIAATALLLASIVSSYWAWESRKSEKLAIKQSNIAQERGQQTEDSYRLMLSIFKDLDADQASELQDSVVDRLMVRLTEVTSEIDDDKFPNPLIRAEMQTTVGRALLGLGNPDAAIKSLRAALGDLESAGSKATVNTLDVMVSLSIAYLDNGELDEAAKLTASIEELVNQIFTKDDPQRLRYETHVATLAVALNSDQAVRMTYENWKNLEQQYGETDRDTLTALNNHAISLQNIGKFDEAAQCLDDLVRKRELSPVLGPNHQDTLRAMQSLATQKLYLKDAAGALELVQTALARARATQALPMDHEVILALMTNLATIMMINKDAVQAKKIYEEIHQKSVSKFGKGYHLAYTALNQIAIIERDAGELIQAAAHFEQVREAIEAGDLGKSNPNYLSILNNLVNVYERAEDWDKAVDRLVESVTTRRQQQPVRETDLYLSIRKLGRLYIQQGDLPRAIEMFAEVYRSGPKEARFVDAATEWFVHFAKVASHEELRDALSSVLNDIVLRCDGDASSVADQYSTVKQALLDADFHDLTIDESRLLGME